MADNVGVRPSTTTGSVSVATDDVSGVHYPLYKLVGESLVPAYIDEYSGAVGAIEQEHLKIHEGKGFTLASRLVIANVGGTHEFLGIVPALTFPHFRKITIASDSGPFDVDFYEGTTVSADGTPVSSFNNDRNSSTTAGLAVYDTPTITADGTLLEAILIPGSKQTGALGSEGSNEWILKAGETYMIRVTNNTVGVGTSNFTVNMFWYE